LVAGKRNDFPTDLSAAGVSFISRCKAREAAAASTLHGYERIAERLGRCSWRGGRTWDDRLLGSFSEQDILAVYEEVLEADLAPDTLNHDLSGGPRHIFGTAARSVALACEWTAPRPDYDKLYVYTPAQVERPKAGNVTASACFVREATTGIEPV
jgi:hypothetical protein